MDYFELVACRRSIRAFTEAPVSEEDLQKILWAASRAPSAGNLQSYELFVVPRSALSERLAQAALDQTFIAQAAVVLVLAAHPARSAPRYGRRGEELYAVQDATIACTFAMLAAASLGLASVWVGAFDEDRVRKAIALPADLVPVAILPLGHAAEEPQEKTRRRLADMIHYRRN